MSSSVRYRCISEGRPLPNLRRYRPFKAVLVIDAGCSEDWQDEVSKWLVRSGCLVVMAWGKTCDVWYDSIDCAQMERFPHTGIPSDEIVRISWHEGETLDKVFWFARTYPHHHSVELRHSFIIHISPKSAAKEMIARYMSAQQYGHLSE